MKTHEKRLYQENSISQQLLLLYILGNTAFTIFCVNHMDVSYRLGVFVMLNVFLSLLAFLTAVRQKMYAIQWGYVGSALAVFQVMRLMWVPAEIDDPLRLLLKVLLIATAMLAFAGSLICIQRSRERQKYIIENNIDPVMLQQ
ncbi:MAG: hypothetical protein WCC12_02810 [Anaerolineales bacterium]